MPAIDPSAVLIVAASAAYLVAAHRRDRTLRRRRSTEPRWMLAAIAVGTLALVGPVDGAAGGSVAWHMVQHVLLIAVVSPLVVLGRPHEILPWLLPHDRRRPLERAGRRLVRSAGSHPVPALVALVGTMWAFHVPALYDAAARSEAWHLVEHAAFLVTACVFWWSLVGGHDRASYGRSMLLVFLLSLSSTALGSLLVAVDRPVYALAAERAAADRVADQQLAGVIMWAFGGVATAVAALSLFAVWLREAERRAPSPRRVRVLAIGPALPLLVAATATGALALRPAPDGPPQPAAAPDAVAQLYERDCAECHGADGGGTEKAPPLVRVGAAYVDYVVSTGRMPIDDPDDEVERGDPAYDRATSVALAELVASFGGEEEPPVAWPIPEVDLSLADVARGGELYRLNCAACHQSVGAGGALVGRAAPPLTTATAIEIAEAVRVGPFEMPSFGEAAMSDDEVRDVTAYVVDVVQEPEDRGGWSISHLGPVPEGAVAFAFGLGILLLVAWWIEGRPEQG